MINEFTTLDQNMMTLALQEASQAKLNAEIPVGAALYLPNIKQYFLAGNQTIKDMCVTSHAEILCLKMASKAISNHRLPGSILYVTLEPCIMCVGALLQARVEKIIVATRDTRENSIHQHIDLFQSPYFNHKIKIHYGLLEEESKKLLKDFFDERRKAKK